MFAGTFGFLDAVSMPALKVLCYESRRFYMSFDCIFIYVLVRNITLPNRKDNQVELPWQSISMDF